MTNHTMFPKDGMRRELGLKLLRLGENRKLKEHNKWVGVSQSGVKIEGYTEPNRTAYPIYTKPNK